jgi:hypothetical protein
LFYMILFIKYYVKDFMKLCRSLNLPGKLGLQQTSYAISKKKGLYPQGVFASNKERSGNIRKPILRKSDLLSNTGDRVLRGIRHLTKHYRNWKNLYSFSLNLKKHFLFRKLNYGDNNKLRLKIY